MEWKDFNKPVIGIIGGMGSYATLDFFERLLDAFPSEKDWEKPRIIIDNNSSFPSRVRAILYDENADVLENKLIESYKNILNAGATDIVLACHTSHYFLKNVESKIDAQKRTLNLIKIAKEQCLKSGIKKVRLMASEGTVKASVYQMYFGEEIKIVNPDEAELKEIRGYIESVKQNKITTLDIDGFTRYIKKDERPIILGCSELPVLYRCANGNNVIINQVIIDPLQGVIDYIKEKYERALKDIVV